MKERLSKLRSRLRALRRRRRLVRWSTAYLALLVALLWLLVGLFLADWLLRMDRPERVVAMVLCIGALAWSFRRHSLPWLGQSESELDMALMVEKQKHIDTDVVAAIQFESPEAPRWGSLALENAVIEHTAELGERLDVTEGLPKDPLRRRLGALVLTAALVGVGIWQSPEYAMIFLNRLLLRSLHYPTGTRIEMVQINGRAVDLTGWGSSTVKIAYGNPVHFDVTCTGVLPDSGEVVLKARRRGVAAAIALQPVAPNAGVPGSRIYSGELPRLIESVSYQLALGDAWTDPGELLVVPLPTADVQLEVAPPPYAADKEAGGPGVLGMRQIAVLEGSQVTLRVVSDKPLKQAQLTIEGNETTFDLARRQEQRTAEQDCWELRPAQTPLDRVLEPIRYSVQVTDTDDLQLERPIQGVIRIKPDQAPRVTASILTKYVLPTARPTVSYAASDDFGLASLSIVPQVVRADGRTEQRDEIVFYRPAQGQTPHRSIQEGYRLDLTPLKLVKGDQLKIAVRATDYRGAGQGKSSVSEPLLFQVTDEAGILAAISEADKESARQLKIMIERQIDVGEGR